MDDLERRMEDVKWNYGDKDIEALTELEKRISEAGRNLQLITYSDLVKGVTFNLPNVNNGKPFQITIYDWTDLHRAILGEFLGYISMRSYKEARFMASALVVNKDEYKPSQQFFKWMRELKVLPDTNEDTVLKFWAEQVNKAHNWYRANRKTKSKE